MDDPRLASPALPVPQVPTIQIFDSIEAPDLGNRLADLDCQPAQFKEVERTIIATIEARRQVCRMLRITHWPRLPPRHACPLPRVAYRRGTGADGPCGGRHAGPGGGRNIGRASRRAD